MPNPAAGDEVWNQLVCKRLRQNMLQLVGLPTFRGPTHKQKRLAAVRGVWSGKRDGITMSECRCPYRSIDGTHTSENTLKMLVQVLDLDLYGHPTPRARC